MWTLYFYYYFAVVVTKDIIVAAAANIPEGQNKKKESFTLMQ